MEATSTNPNGIAAREIAATHAASASSAEPAASTGNASADLAERAPPSCKLCGARTSPTLRSVPAVRSCPQCGIASLQNFPDRAGIESFYQDDYYSAETGARFLKAFELPFLLFRLLRYWSIARRAQAARRPADSAPAPGTSTAPPSAPSLLDVGCGRGDLLQLFQSRGWRALGTQLSRTAAQAARQHRGVEVVCGELPDLELEPGQFSVITFFHVLEHLPDPAPYLDRAHALLAKGGLLVVEVPDFSAPGFRVLGERCFCFDHPHHLIFFTPESLRGCLEAHGFHVEAQSRFSLEYSPYTTLQNWLNALPGTPNRLYRALMRNAEARRLRKSPWTWLHAALGGFLAPVAALVSFGAALRLWPGNTLRLYCRKQA